MIGGEASLDAAISIPDGISKTIIASSNALGTPEIIMVFTTELEKIPNLTLNAMMSLPCLHSGVMLHLVLPLSPICVPEVC